MEPPTPMFPFCIYSRKSSEASDSQVLSIPSQESEMLAMAARYNLVVSKPYLSEAKSAKAPGRAVFNELMKKVERGEIRGILCWKLDRLARNPVDGGRIIWAIMHHGLVIRTPNQTFSREEDNIILMYIEFGMAQKYVDDLSQNTSRGLEDKAKAGWCPGGAKLGYLNSKVEVRGKRTVLKDPERFYAARRMWEMMLTGNYSPSKIQSIANNEWGFRTRRTKKTGGKPLSRSTTYRMFSDPFYYGEYEYPKKSGKWYRGLHEPMVTKAEFNLVQRILHRDTNPRPYKELDLAYRGLIKCGGCGSSITAHYKIQVRCTKCHYKSSVKNQGSCAKCKLPVEKMDRPNIRSYGYYHCTRTLNPNCKEKSIPISALESQVTAKIKLYGLPSELRDWGLSVIQGLRGQDIDKKSQIMAERKKAYDQCAVQLQNLIKLKTAAENADNSLLSDEEYQTQREELLKRKASLSLETASFDLLLETKTRVTTDAIEVVAEIEKQPPGRDSFKNRQLLSALGLNHEIKEKELVIKPEFPFSEFPAGGFRSTPKITPIEPDNSHRNWASDRLKRPTSSRLGAAQTGRSNRAMKKALERIWKQVEPWAVLVKRKSLKREPWELEQIRVRGKNGKYISPRSEE